MRAWKGVKELAADDPRSFVLGGYHGEPFRGAGWGSSAYWAASAITATSGSRPGTALIW